MLKKFVHSKSFKLVGTALCIASILAISCICAFATGEETTAANLNTAMTTAFTTVKTDIFGYIAAILPISLAILGAFWGIKKAIGFFKSTSR